jgi:hypothetical protein
MAQDSSFRVCYFCHFPNFDFTILMTDIAKFAQILDSIGTIQDPVAKKMIAVEEKEQIIDSILQQLEENQLKDAGEIA